LDSPNQLGICNEQECDSIGGKFANELEDRFYYGVRYLRHFFLVKRMLGAAFNMEADSGGGFQYGGGLQRQISIWRRIPGADLIWRRTLGADFNMEADSGGRF
jgi:hypothetical protein